METHIALLRGINVAGQKKVLMKELRALLERAGFENVQTYIQSGNVIFQSLIKEKETVERLLFDAIKQHFGFEVPVFMTDFLTLQTILNACPFSQEKKKKSYFTLLKTEPESQLLETLSLAKSTNEEIIVTKRCVYFYSATGYGKSKLNNNYIEKQLKVTATTRNYKTVIRLLEISEEIIPNKRNL